LRLRTPVLIIGAGVTGTGLARDLAIRGIRSVVVEKQDVNAGASGGNHGLLHSGARYIFSDLQSADECQKENLLLKQLAPGCIEKTGGLFVAVTGDNENDIADFPHACASVGIPAKALDVNDVRQMEPALSSEVIAAFEVNDATIDPFKLSLENIVHAQHLGSRLLTFHQVMGFDLKNGSIRQTHVRDELTGKIKNIKADIIINAAGAWSGIIASMAGAHIDMWYSKGSMLVTQDRMATKVLNRLRPPSDGDILVPAGTVSILGTTSEKVASPDDIHPDPWEVDAIIDSLSELVPDLKKTRYIRAYCGVRPLLACATTSGSRSLRRSFELVNHQREPEKIDNFLTITGGKLTTFRLMAEKTADEISRRLGKTSPCRTHQEPFPDAIDARWTEPGLPPDTWPKEKRYDQKLMCECEMVPQSVVDKVISGLEKHNGRPSLRAIGLRSRVGKGPCQGTFCSQRLAAYLYRREYLHGQDGIRELRIFLQERWRGQHPLLWDIPLIQAELLEAIHCGIFCIELNDDIVDGSQNEKP
jgi:glycerol-3-phosphate dehydrogenase